jgi:hypothetical protein
VHGRTLKVGAINNDNQLARNLPSMMTKTQQFGQQIAAYRASVGLPDTSNTDDTVWPDTIPQAFERLVHTVMRAAATPSTGPRDVAKREYMAHAAAAHKARVAARTLEVAA